jgi:hypothetical protein
MGPGEGPTDPMIIFKNKNMEKKKTGRKMNHFSKMNKKVDMSIIGSVQ